MTHLIEETDVDGIPDFSIRKEAEIANEMTHWEKEQAEEREVLKTVEVLIAEPIMGVSVNVVLPKDNPDSFALDRYIIRNKVNTLEPTIIEFHRGSVVEGNCNGILNESLIHVLVNRITDQNKVIPCEENEVVLNSLKTALEALQKRNNRTRPTLDSVE